MRNKMFGNYVVATIELVKRSNWNRIESGNTLSVIPNHTQAKIEISQMLDKSWQNRKWRWLTNSPVTRRKLRILEKWRNERLCKNKRVAYRNKTYVFIEANRTVSCYGARPSGGGRARTDDAASPHTAASPSLPATFCRRNDLFQKSQGQTVNLSLNSWDIDSASFVKQFRPRTSCSRGDKLG